MEIRTPSDDAWPVNTDQIGKTERRPFAMTSFVRYAAVQNYWPRDERTASGENDE